MCDVKHVFVCLCLVHCVMLSGLFVCCLCVCVVVLVVVGVLVCCELYWLFDVVWLVCCVCCVNVSAWIVCVFDVSLCFNVLMC